MSDLQEFLLARIDEDEAVAGRASSFTPWDRDFQNDNYGHLTVQPFRMEAECGAKRAIIELHKPDWSEPGVPEYNTHYEIFGKREVLVDDDEPMTPYWCTTCGEPSPCLTVRFLAIPYASHADYLEEWRPTQAASPSRPHESIGPFQ